MELDAAKMIGAGLAVIALAGVGVGIGNIFSSLVSSIARNPAARGEVFGIGILGFALTEAIALFALLVSFLNLFTRLALKQPIGILCKKFSCFRTYRKGCYYVLIG